MQYYVYMMASKKFGTLYIGMTSDLMKRVSEHQLHERKGFTEKYNVLRLVYYEVFDDVKEAILREKRMKKWYRKWKIELIEKTNPEWNDLTAEIHGFPLARE